MKCDKVERLAMLATESDGSFKADLPSSSLPSNCLAKLLGGPKQLYASRKHMISKIVKAQQAHEPNSCYTISTPLSFSISCPSKIKCGSPDAGTGAAKTFDLPLPPEWGLAPTSYYVPVPLFPIIGVPWLSILDMLVRQERNTRLWSCVMEKTSWYSV